MECLCYAVEDKPSGSPCLVVEHGDQIVSHIEDGEARDTSGQDVLGEVVEQENIDSILLDEASQYQLGDQGDQALGRRASQKGTRIS